MSEAAANELTFLFTDIEGSTSLWEHQPEAMQAALARHDALMRQHIRRRHGRVFKTVGDAFYAVFANALEALRAAIDLQHALHEADWGGIDEIKVRMAIHTGGAEQRNGDYFGPTLNRIARLLAVAHGGQILLSGATRQAIGDELPGEAELRDMGQYQLRDIIRIEQIFQVLAPGLPDEFPPLHASTSTPHNLPVQVTSFIGREELISQSCQQLRQTHLLTLTGSGGTGKTRLSLQVAERLLRRFPDGVWFVELAPLSDPSLVPQAIGQAVRLREERDQPLMMTLGEYFGAKQMLLILDNCEHLIDAAAQAAEALLRQCPQLRVLATSREALSIAGETTLRIPSLQLPDPAGEDLEPLAASEAVRLLLDRVRAVQPSFALTAQNAAAIAAICRRLDGIPLALELAAARFKVMDVESIAGRLDDRFKLLTSGNRTALPRQQTLRALIDWSHDLLAQTEQILLRRLAVFAGG
ncbi:MAG TPA: adenylate/guanylate cyclase domain-containing protein, partial [Herpetosiphonaceae bacterium]